MTTPTFKARQMKPYHDTIATMAQHYGVPVQRVREAIRETETTVIREDGHQGTLDLVRNGNVGRPRLGWNDGVVGIDPETTVLTEPAIKAVARKLWRQRHGR
jgi:hypothetical protein